MAIYQISNEELDNLLMEYKNIKDSLIEFTDNFHDDMQYDIDGYWDYYSLIDERDIKDLKIQVEAFKNLLKGYRKLQYKFN